MKQLIFILLFALSLSSLTATEAILDEAKDAYMNEEYAYAAEKYEEIISLGYESPYLYYNLGNAYFKDNKFGRAILNYERAKKLAPSNEEIKHNLKIANERIVDKVEPVPLIFYERWWRSIVNWQNADNWAKTGIILLFLFLGAAALYLFARTIFIKKISFYIGLVIFFFCVSSFILASNYNKVNLSENTAIVMTMRSTAKSSPSENSNDVFVIHEGTKVKITNNLGQWTEIKLANGNVGWVKKEVLVII
jgi:tetratricopeptide (TPR) repeat protein